ncbi:MAG: ribonuclease D [Steroidobacteraceae bacterium]
MTAPIMQPDALAALAGELAAAPAFGLDTEFLRERTYRAELCLLQVATETRAESIDPLSLQLQSLTRPFAAPGIVKVMHAARQDLEVLWPAVGAVTPVFDTQIAAALTGMPTQVGYGELVRRVLNVDLAKGQTRTDWSKRPLSEAQLKYALDDVRYLLPLRDLLSEELERLGRMEWLAEELANLARPEGFGVDPDKAHERLKGLRELDDGRRALGQQLAAWRERRAAQRNLPRGWVMDDSSLREILVRVPRDLAALAEVRGLPNGFPERFGPEILELIASLQLPERMPAMPGRTRPDPEAIARVQRLAEATRQIGTELNIGPEILATRRELERLAAGDRELELLSGWRAGVLGQRLLALL